MKFKSIHLIFTSFSILSISGCSTPYDLKKTHPMISYATSKAAKDVKKCVLDKWRMHQSNVLEEKTNGGWLIRFNDTLPTATVAIVTIEESELDTKVNYYHRTNRVKLHRLEDGVKDCK